jgi:neutral ceramidase
MRLVRFTATCSLASSLSVGAFALTLLAGCPPPDKKEGFVPPKPGPLRAAAAVAPLGLPVGHSHAGYFQSKALGDEAPPDDPGSPFAGAFPATRGIQSAPSARVIVLDNGHTDLVMVRLDAIYTTEEITATVLERAQKRLGRDLRGRLLINATHTHGAGHRASSNSTRPASLQSEFRPEEAHGWALGGDTFSPESLHRIVEPIVDAMEEAYDHLRPARFGYGFGENNTAAGDRRCESDWLYGPDDSDKRVTVMRIDDDETGGPIAMVVGYAMHGIAYDRDSRSLTVDSPGHVEYAIESAMPEPMVAFFLQGNVGDSTQRGWRRGHQQSQAMARAGWDLAQTALDVYQGIETEHELPLSGIDRTIALGHELLGYPVEEFHFGGGLICSTGQEGCEVTGPAPPGDVFCIGAADLEGAKTRTWISALRIGKLHVIGLPGEPVGSYGKALAAAVEDLLPSGSDVVVAGLAMDHNGYLLEADDWLSGGYEPTISPWGWRMGPYLRTQMLDLVGELTTGKAKGDKLSRAKFDFERTPVPPTTSSLPIGETLAPAASVRRLETVSMEFEGGDPAVDQPVATVERQVDGTWTPVLDGAWKVMSSMNGPRLPMLYTATPTYKAAPEATERDHRWVLKWEATRDAPLGQYRLVVNGHHYDGSTQAYLINSTPFEVRANDALVVEARRINPTDATVHLTVRYPAQAPGFSTLAGSEEWQIDGYVMVDPWFSPPFVPMLVAPLNPTSVTVIADGVEADAPLSFHSSAIGDTIPQSYLPGDGPGFSADLPTATSLEVRVAAGAITDEWGNGNAEASFVLAP